MLKSLHIKNFRGFRDLKIEPLKRVNLITGQNNTGKTCVLEALTLLLDEPKTNKDLFTVLPNLFRPSGGDATENFWKWLFNNRGLDKTIEINASLGTSNAVDLGVQLRNPSSVGEQRLDEHGRVIEPKMFGDISCYSIGRKDKPIFKPAIFSTHPSNPVQDAIDYNRVILKRRKKQVEKLLQEIEPRLQAVEALQIGQSGQSSSPLIYADLGLSEMIPVTQLGQGFNRLLDIYSEIVAADAQVLLIDEIENGMHYSVMPVIWKGLFLAAKEFDVQIFATTHSWECILAADEAARAAENYDLALIRLDRVKDDIKATVIDEKSLSTAKELHWEMR
jgi:predicted ATP-dependent endonuclease of OLD family